MFNFRLLTRMSTLLPFRSTSVMESLFDRDILVKMEYSTQLFPFCYLRFLEEVRLKKDLGIIIQKKGCGISMLFFKDVR